jgi:hypothetical protein
MEKKLIEKFQKAEGSGDVVKFGGVEGFWGIAKLDEVGEVKKVEEEQLESFEKSSRFGELPDCIAHSSYLNSFGMNAHGTEPTISGPHSCCLDPRVFFARTTQKTQGLSPD